MALNLTLQERIGRLNIKETVLIIGLSCCVGVVFNLFWENKIAFITPSKAEIYAKKNIPSLSLEEARAIFDKDEAIFLDARKADDYNLRHIKGALNLPVTLFDLYYPKMKKRLPKDRKIVVYCEGESCGASLHLSEELIGLNYKKIQVFLGGWIDWKKAGYPEE